MSFVQARAEPSAATKKPARSPTSISERNILIRAFMRTLQESWKRANHTPCWAPRRKSAGRALHGLRTGQEVRENKPFALDDLAAADRHGVAEHRTGVGERVELAALTAGVDAPRQAREQRLVELSS